MTRLSVLMLLAAAACSKSAPPPAQNAQASAAPAAAMAPPQLAVAPQDSGAVPKPGALKTFGDWTVGCDNVLTCTVASLGPDGGDFPAVTIAVTRAAGPAGAVAVALAPHQDASPVAKVAIDGTPVDPKAQPGAFVAAMTNGQAVTIRDAQGVIETTQSLKGASAALRYVDAVQGRADGVTALVARGAKPASAVPAAPALPVILAVPPGGAPANLTPAQVKAMRAQAQCEPPISPDQPYAPEAYALGGGATLVLVPCSTGAYNLSSALFVLKGGTMSPAALDAPSGFAPPGEGLPQVVNGSFEKGVLSSYAKGRGLGDCGGTQDFVWDGAKLRLSHQADMGECRGNPDYVTTWTAKVVR